MQISTLRPGLLVSMKTDLRGNVSYATRDIEADHIEAETGARRAVWETARRIDDPVEHARAIKVRTKCRTLITRECAWSAFGLLCPEANREKLDNAVRAAQALADEFNSTAQLTRIGIYVVIGRIAADDVQAIRAISDELGELLQTMQSGLMSLDVDAVRAAATRARSLGSMLTEGAATRVQDAISAARAVAVRMVKAGDQAARELDREVIAQIVEVRRSFLDLDQGGTVAEPAAVGRGIDLDPAEAERPVAVPAGRELDI